MQGMLTSKDFWSGLMLLALGAGAMLVASGYEFGSTLQMGPGYFPVVLGAVLALFGIAIMLRALRSIERMEGGWSLRALVILPAAFVAFGLLMDRVGFVPSLVVLIFISALAGPEFRFREVALLTAFLTAMSVLVFIYGLGMPYPLF